MKTLAWLFSILVLSGCATNPLMTGQPQDWVGHSSSELLAGLGEPTRRIQQANGEVWEYRDAGNMIAPETSQTHFGAGTVPFQGVQGDITTTKTPSGVSNYENVTRFLIRNDKVRQWYAARVENGKIVWQDH